MPSDLMEIHVATDRPDRRALLARFCEELASALTGDRQWMGDGFVVPWHASANEFDSLPERVVAAILEEWDDAGGRLAGIEFSGYLDTDHGPRAWGSLLAGEGGSRERSPELVSCTVERAGEGYRIDARLRPGSGADD